MSAPVLLLEPPYHSLRSSGSGSPPVGTVLVADLTGDADACVAAAAAATRVHRRFPWCPVCLVVGPAAMTRPVLDALAGFQGSAAWIARSPDAGLPGVGDIMAAVRERPGPSGEAVAAYITARLDGKELQVDPDRVARELNLDGGDGDQISWEWLVESALRDRGYVSVP